MLIPVPTPAGDPAEIADLRARVLLLEQVVVVALRKLSATVEGVPDPHAAKDALAEVGQLVTAGKKPEAARRYRELFGVSWDEAHSAIARWKASRAEELARCLWLKWFVETTG